MSQFNYIAADNIIKYYFAIEQLVVHRINKTKYYHIQHICPNYIPSDESIRFIQVNIMYASYDKLLSIMKPHGIKVLTEDNYIQLGFHKYDYNFTKDKLNNMYEPGESSIFSPPIDSIQHLHSIIQGLPYMYCYNLRTLISTYPQININVNKLRHRAIINALTKFLLKRIQHVNRILSIFSLINNNTHNNTQ
jgi:hypothetical protein